MRLSHNEKLTQIRNTIMSNPKSHRNVVLKAQKAVLDNKMVMFERSLHSDETIKLSKYAQLSDESIARHIAKQVKKMDHPASTKIDNLIDLHIVVEKKKISVCYITKGMKWETETHDSIKSLKERYSIK